MITFMLGATPYYVGQEVSFTEVWERGKATTPTGRAQRWFTRTVPLRHGVVVGYRTLYDGFTPNTPEGTITFERQGAVRALLVAVSPCRIVLATKGRYEGGQR